MLERRQDRQLFLRIGAQFAQRIGRDPAKRAQPFIDHHPTLLHVAHLQIALCAGRATDGAPPDELVDELLRARLTHAELAADLVVRWAGARAHDTFDDVGKRLIPTGRRGGKPRHKRDIE